MSASIIADRNSVSFLDCNPRFGPKPYIAPVLEPVSLAEVKRQARIIDDGAENSDFEAHIAAARQMVETQSCRAFITQTWKLYLDRFPSWQIELRKCPVSSVTSITYIDTDGNTQTLDAADYIAALNGEPAILAPSWGNVWPEARDQPESVVITFVAGYGATPDLVPEPARHAVRILAAYYMNTGREAYQKLGDAENRMFDFAIDQIRWTAYG